MEIMLGNTIKQLRRNKNISQEQLANVLGITPQAVSRWETNIGYPDMELIPVIANYFGISLDVLFGYDVAKQNEKIAHVIKKSNQYVWSDKEKAEEILNEALKDYPRNPKLLCALLTLYECHMRADKTFEQHEKAVRIAESLISESDDIFVICSAKADLASIYQMNNEYEKAKEIIASLPYMYPYMLNDKMRCSAYLLKGEERLKEAKEFKMLEIQELYVACFGEGEGYFETGKYEQALESFTQCQRVIELFMKDSTICPEAYLWSGMQTHHWSSCLAQAGCLEKLHKKDEAKKMIEKAHTILSHAWGAEFLEDKEMFLTAFEECYQKFEL